MFEINYGFSDLNDKYKIVERTAIKGVVNKDDKLLLIHTNKGDYKFPGGGIKKNESMEQALERELLEETGYHLINMGEVLGSVTETKIDEFEENAYFVMKSIYVACDIDWSKCQEQKLDEYEAEQNFQVAFANVTDAVKNNQEILKRGDENMNAWVERETDVLKALTK